MTISTNSKKYFPLKNKTLIFILTVILLGFIFGGIIYSLRLNNIENNLSASLRQFENLRLLREKKLSEFAKCLSSKGIKLYGAATEEATQRQKARFGVAARYLPYIECVEPESGEMNLRCLAAEVEKFPTWKFPDGKMVIGDIAFKDLEKLSGCKL